MNRLKLYLLGRPRIEINGKSADPLLMRRKNACALLYYLALNRRPFPRTELAQLLWANVELKVSLNRLRGASVLTTLRSKKFGLTPFLTVNDDSLAIYTDENTEVQTDVEELESILRRTHAPIADVARVVKLYQGDFWTGFDVPGVSVDFEDWVTTRREYFRRMAIDGLHRLAVYHTEWQEYTPAKQYTDRLLRIEPLMEQAHRQMMLLLAWDGRREAALAHYERCRAILKEELAVEPSTETQEQYRAIRNETLKPPLPIPFLAPDSVEYFTGREEQLATLTEVVVPSPNRRSHSLVALVGMPGVGKSTLATELAHKLREEKAFQHGILWADPTLSGMEDVIDNWAEMYGSDFSSRGSLKARELAWRGLTQNKSILMVLDNVENDRQVRSIRPNSPRSTVLFTTRDRDVAVSLGAQVIDVSILSEEDALALLANVLGEERISAELEHATTLCKLVENLPLALEILAQRLLTRRSMSLKFVAAHLATVRNRLDMLHISNRAVRASFDVSWSMLDGALRETFAALAVFEGRPFDENALAAVAELDDFRRVADPADLVGLSLLGRHAPDEDQPIYRQHALLAEFAREKSSDGLINLEDTQRRFVQWFHRFADEMRDDDQAIRINWPNLQAGLKLAHDTHDWEMTVSYGERLAPIWMRLARYSDAREQYPFIFNAAGRLEDDETVAHALIDCGVACLEQSDFDEARQFFEQAADVLQQFEPNGHNAARVDLLLARLLYERSDFAAANERLRSVREKYRLLESDAGVAESLLYEAKIAYYKLDLERAGELAESSYALFEKIDAPDVQIQILCLLADIFIRGDVLDSAEAHLDHATSLNTHLRDESVAPLIETARARLFRKQEKWAEADRALGRAIQSYTHIGDTKSEAFALHSLSLSKKEQGRLRESLSLAKRSLIIMRELEIDSSILSRLLLIGDLHCLLHDENAARGCVA